VLWARHKPCSGLSPSDRGSTGEGLDFPVSSLTGYNTGKACLALDNLCRAWYGAHLTLKRWKGFKTRQFCSASLHMTRAMFKASTHHWASWWQLCKTVPFHAGVRLHQAPPIGRCLQVWFERGSKLPQIKVFSPCQGLSWPKLPIILNT
jgi:hypothetical protein